MSTYSRKKWREDREKIIANSDGNCSWCRREGTLVVHHINPPKFGLIAYNEVSLLFFEEYFDNGAKEDEFNKLMEKAVDWVLKKVKKKTVNRCPTCYRATLYERKTMEPKYKCTSCKHVCDEIIEDKTIWYPSLYRSVIFNFNQDYKKQIKEKYEAYKIKANSDYNDLEKSDIILICKKCHYAHHNGMVLCKTCKKKYHKRKYSSCYTCKTENVLKGERT